MTLQQQRVEVKRCGRPTIRKMPCGMSEPDSPLSYLFLEGGM